MNITVNGKEYILEYTFEAAECHECIDAAMDIFGGMMTAKIDSKHSEEIADVGMEYTLTVDTPIQSNSPFTIPLVKEPVENLSSTFCEYLLA